MNLLVDIGNSVIKWAAYNSGDLPKSKPLLIEPGAAYYQISNLLEVLESHWDKTAGYQRLVVANVAGKAIADSLQHWTKTNWKIEPEFVQVSDQAYGVSNAYRDIKQLGIDRWMAIIAAWKNFGNALCVVDCGTAITIDGISDTGQHLGGMILPGITMMQRALFEQTQGIPEFSNIPARFEFADNTQQAVISACVMAAVSLIDRLVNNMQSKYGDKLICVLTGGGANQISNLLAAEFKLEPNLVLQGLAYVTEGKT